MNKRELIDVIEQFTGQKNLLTIPRIMINFFEGDIYTALLFSQIIYWSGKSETEWWFKSYQDWQDEIGVNEYHVRKSIKKLEKLGFIETKIKKAHGNPTLHFRLETAIFSETFLQFLKKRNFKISRNETANFKETSNSKLHTEITTVNYNNKDNSSAENSSDFIDQIINIFSDLFYQSRGFEYVKSGKDRKAVGSLLKQYKAKNPNSNSEQTLKDFGTFFKQCLAIDDKWYSENMTLPIINSKINEIRVMLKRKSIKVQKESAEQQKLADALEWYKQINSRRNND